MAQNSVYSWLYSPFIHAKQHSTHRRLLVVSDSESACIEKVAQLLTPPSPIQTEDKSLATIEIGLHGTMQGNVRKHLLGNEYDIGVLHCHQGFSPGDLLALSGTLRFGGCLILSTPPFEQWIQTPFANKVSFGYQPKASRYIKRLVDIFTRDPQVSLWTPTRLRLADILQTQLNSDLANHSTSNKQLDNNVGVQASVGVQGDDECVGVQPTMGVQSDDESVGVQPTMDVLSGDESVGVHRLNGGQRHVYSELIAMRRIRGVITAPRGRGKSSLLGVLAAYFVAQGKTLYITSTVRRNVSTLLEHAHQSLARLEQRYKNSFYHPPSGGSLTWLATDNPKLFNSPCDLLMVDEAASLPLPLLQKCLNTHGEWLLATTLQGYEGSGQGFIHRMLPTLIAQQAKHYTLTHPFRWVANDQLERLINQLCLFEKGSQSFPSPLSHTSPLSLSPDDIESGTLTACNLATMAYSDLQEAMQLLALAHYQTTPDDFMRIIDSTDLRLFVYRRDAKIIAAAVIHTEGGEALAPLASEIAQGRRRPAGHLSAQRIAVLCADERFATYTYWRINRIAVHPNYRNKGIGSHVLRELQQSAKQKNIDCITSSYGATDKLNRFWHQNGYEIIDKGLKANKASGEVSALVICPISVAFMQDASILTTLYQASCTEQVTPWCELDTRVQDIYLNRLSHFCEGFSNLDQVAVPLANFCRHLCSNQPGSSDAAALLAALPLNKSILSQTFNANGKTHLNQAIRRWLKPYLASKTPN